MSCSQWSPGTDKAVAFGLPCVLWVCVQPPNPTTGCGDNILWGQPRVLPTGWHFWQPLIEPGVLNYSYRCYGERLPFSQDILTPRWIVAVSEHSSNDLGLWCLLGQMAAQSLSAHMLKAPTSRCFSGQSKPVKLNQPGFVFQLGELGGNIWHLLISFSAIPHFITAVLMEIWTIWIITIRHWRVCSLKSQKNTLCHFPLVEDTTCYLVSFRGAGRRVFCTLERARQAVSPFQFLC